MYFAPLDASYQQKQLGIEDQTSIDCSTWLWQHHPEAVATVSRACWKNRPRFLSASSCLSRWKSHPFHLSEVTFEVYVVDWDFQAELSCHGSRQM
ncbi:hypothetical protein Plhal304r1_c069g0157621 [Plasmopara halstedii]